MASKSPRAILENVHPAGAYDVEIQFIVKIADKRHALTTDAIRKLRDRLNEVLR